MSCFFSQFNFPIILSISRQMLFSCDPCNILQVLIASAKEKEYSFTTNLNFFKKVVKRLKWGTVLILKEFYMQTSQFFRYSLQIHSSFKPFQNQKSNKFQNKNWDCCSSVKTRTRVHSFVCCLLWELNLISVL